MTDLSQFDIMHLIYLVLLLIFVSFGLSGEFRRNFFRTIRQLLSWALIIVGVVVAVAMWEDIRDAALPPQAVFTDEGRIEIQKSADGHFRLTAEVNGADIDFIVDTGASDLVLSQTDAVKAGLTIEELNFYGRAMTANGEVRTAPVRLNSVVLGTYEDTNVRARVNGGDLETSLLGMSFLNRYEQITITRGKLILTR